MNVRTEIEGTLVYDLVASEDLLEEARDVLERPRMRRYVPESPVPEYIARVRAVALMVLGHFAGDVCRATLKTPTTITWWSLRLLQTWMS